MSDRVDSTCCFTDRCESSLTPRTQFSGATLSSTTISRKTHYKSGDGLTDFKLGEYYCSAKSNRCRPLMRWRFKCPANRYVLKSRPNCSVCTSGSREWSGSEFQTEIEIWQIFCRCSEKKRLKMSSDWQIINIMLEIGVVESNEYNHDVRMLTGSSNMAVSAHAQYSGPKQPRKTGATSGAGSRELQCITIDTFST